jgi:F0F1-type ATP synthase membrane subunit b/b'
VAFNQIFSQVGSFQKFVPFFEKATGNFSTTLSLNTLLNNDMSLNLSSLKANGKFSTSSVALKDVPALSALASGLKKPELSNPSLKDLAVNFEISNGKLFTKPFDIKLGDIKMNLGGSMGLDQSLDFKGIVQLPDQLNAGRFSNFNVTIGGTYDKPKVKLDLLDTFNEALEETKAKIKEEVATQVDAAKKEVVEKARKEREAALKEAQVQADKIRLEAKKAGDKLIEEATLKGNELVEKAANPIAKKVAEQSARKLVEEARKQADKLNADAEIQANKIIENASKSTNF